MKEDFFQLGGRDIEKQLFNIYFLNWAISLNNKFRNTELLIPIDNTIMEGTIIRFSIYVLVFVLSFVENHFWKIRLDLPVFCHTIKTKPWIRNLRHGSLQMNVMNMLVKFQKIYAIVNEKSLIKN